MLALIHYLKHTVNQEMDQGNMKFYTAHSIPWSHIA